MPSSRLAVRPRPSRFAPLAALALLLGCAAGEISFPERTPTPLDPARAGRIEGTVRLDGEPPQRVEINLGGYPACTAHRDTALSEAVIVNQGKLQNAFVHVKSGLEGQVFAIPREPVLLDQKGCVFIPHVLGVQAYQPIRLLNSDNLLHNVRAEAKSNKSFNLGLDQAGSQKVRQLTTPEVMIPIRCDVHGWMLSYVGVIDHPYFAVSDERGTFAIDGLPAGTYELEAWHEVYGTETRTIELGERQTATVEFVFRPR